MIATVKQGMSEAQIEVAENGVSLADVICTALGYGAIELQGVIVTFKNTEEPNPGNTEYLVGYQFGKGSGLFHATVSFKRA